VTGHPPWQLAPASGPAPALVWETGIDAAFVTSVVAFLLLGAIAAWAISGVARAARVEPIAVQVMTN